MMQRYIKQLVLPLGCMYRTILKPTQIYHLSVKARYSSNVTVQERSHMIRICSSMYLLNQHNIPEHGAETPSVWQTTNPNALDLSNLGIEHKLTNRNALDLSSSGIKPKLCRLSLSPRLGQSDQLYILPTVDRVTAINHAILDPQITNTVMDCPTKNNLLDIIDPLHNPMNDHQQLPGTAKNEETKEASSGKGTGRVIRHRKRKMNKHRRKKFLKRTRFLRWRIKQNRKRKKRIKWNKHLDSIKFKQLYPWEIRQEIRKRQEEWAIYQKFVEHMEMTEDNQTPMESSSKRN
ncbi:uncharacterized protein LOC144451587 [Glandiceps talaboti]